MLVLILGLAIFFAAHLVPTQPALRAGLVGRFGETAYKIAFSAVALAGLVLIVLGYHKLQIMPGKNPVLWNPPAWTRHITFLLMIPAMILLAAFLIPSKIGSKAKHPMLAALKTWAFAHLISNGDLGSLTLFGSFLAYGVYDRISVKRRPEAPVRAPAPAGMLNDVIVVVLGLALYAAMVVWGHGALIGVPLIRASLV